MRTTKSIADVQALACEISCTSSHLRQYALACEDGCEACELRQLALDVRADLDAPLDPSGTEILRMHGYERRKAPIGKWNLLGDRNYIVNAEGEIVAQLTAFEVWGWIASGCPVLDVEL